MASRGRTWSSLLANLALAGGSLVATLLLLEGAARVERRLRGGGKGTGEQGLYFEHDPRLGWRKRAGTRVTYRRAEYTVEVAINSHGLRDPERTYPAGRARILALGDSFVEGFTVPLDQTLTQVLERLLATPGCAVEVVNAGTAGYSTDQEYLFYLHEGQRFPAGIVLLFFFYNDVLPTTSARYFGTPKPLLRIEGDGLVPAHDPVPAPRRNRGPQVAAPEPMRGSAALAWVARRLMVGAPLAFNSLARLGLWEPLGDEVPHQQLHVYKRKRQPAIEEAWELTEAILGRLRDEARGRGAKFAVVYVPSRMEVSDRDWDLTRLRYGFDDKWDRRLVVQRLEQVGAAVGFPVLDLTRTLREADQGLLGEPYLRLDSHWTRLGHHAAAQAVAGFLRSLGWLPPVSCAPHEAGDMTTGHPTRLGPRT